MEKEKIVSIEDRIPKLKEQRKKKANRRLVFYLSIFFILISIIVYLQSPLSQVKQFEVSGNNVLTDEEIIKFSGITPNTNIWVVQKNQIKQKFDAHPVIESVEINRKLPQTIQFNVKEHQIIGFMSEGTTYHPILQNGTIITNETIDYKGDGPLLHNFKEDAFLKRMAAELNEIPEDIFNLISEIIWVPTEKNKYKITMYMNDGFIVDATIRNLATKMETYPSIVSQIEDGDKGIIHMGVGTYFEKIDE